LHSLSLASSAWQELGSTQEDKIMAYTKLQSHLDLIDRQVRSYYTKQDDQAVIDLAWRMGFDGDDFFSLYAQRLISDMFPGLLDMASQSYQDGQSDS
jgi:hypothetical protein